MSKHWSIRCLLALALLVSLLARAEIQALPGIRVENLSAALRHASVWLGPSTDFEVLGRSTWLLTGDNQIVDLGSGQRALPKGFVAHSFARTREGAVAVITENILGVIVQGMFIPTIKLPYGNMRVVAGPNETLLLYGGPDGDQYLISSDGPTFSTVARVTEPIGAVSYAADRLFFAAGNKLYTAKWGEAPALVFLFPDNSAIVGMAVNTRSGEIFLSTADAIFVLNHGVAFKAVEGLGGRLQWRDAALYVVDSGRGLLVRVRFP